MSQDEKKKLSRNLSDKFREFITQHPPSQFSRHLRCLLLDYMTQQRGLGFPLDFHVHLWELSDLFILLDCAEDEWEKSPKDGKPACRQTDPLRE
jgi:hypothetical protein